MMAKKKGMAMLGDDRIGLFLGGLTLIIILVGGGWILWTEVLNPSGAKALSASEIEARLKEYVGKTVPDAEASILSVEKEGKNLYRVELSIGGQEFTSYITSDGRLLFPSAVNLDDFFKSVEEMEQGGEAPSPGNQEPSSQAPKTERPDVKLFVMSYCPYGLQAEKGLLPVWGLLGDKADMGIYFVNYIMHDKKEIDENLRQYCISQEYPGKYTGYLECFVESGEYEECLSQVGLSRDQLSSCESETDNRFQITQSYENKDEWLNGRYPKFGVHSDLNEQYGVQGSPTLVINGQVVSPSGRSPEDYKQAVCSAFEERPSECDQQLATQSFEPGFGSGSGGTVSSGSCE